MTASKSYLKRMYDHVCLRCEKGWSSELEKPKRCRHCSSPYWWKMTFSDKDRLIESLVTCGDCGRQVVDSPRVEAGMACGPCAYGEGEGPSEQEEEN